MAEERRPPMNTNWSIDTTTKSVVSLGIGILTAASSDDVQPLAILACERYGATLAMCPETCMKVERLAKRRYTSHAFHRISVKIGFAPGDSADQLASSEAGVRFLALTAALLPIGTPFQVAQCLHTLLDETSPEGQLLPTVRQLKDLILVLMDKISCSGFVEYLEGWDTVLRSDVLGLQDLFLVPHLEELETPLPGATASSQRRSEDQDLTQPRSSTQNQHLSSSSDDGSGPARTDNAGQAQAGPAASHEPHGDQDAIVPATNNVLRELLDRPVVHPVTSEAVLKANFLQNLGLSSLFSGLWSSSQIQDGNAPVRAKRITWRSDLEFWSWRSGCPSVKEISKLLRAMSEMARLGEASFTIVRTPPLMAVWTIAFIRWCLGVEPYIRRVNGQQLVLKQSKSRVLVELEEHGAETFSVRTFKTFRGIHELLWESQSTAVKSVPWNGMIKIKAYFNTRLQKLQTSSSLPCHSHILVTFLFLASKLEEALYQVFYQTAPDSATLHFAVHCSPIASLFSARSRLISLIAIYFDIEEPWAQISSHDRNTISNLWENYDRNVSRTVVGLFLDIAASATIENVHYNSDPEVWVRCASHFDYSRIPISDLFDQLEIGFSSFLGSEAVGGYIQAILAPVGDLGIDPLAQRALFLLGINATQSGNSDIVAFSNNGQVAYFTLLESLYAHRDSIFVFTVLPGGFNMKANAIHAFQEAALMTLASKIPRFPPTTSAMVYSNSSHRVKIALG